MCCDTLWGVLAFALLGIAEAYAVSSWGSKARIPYSVATLDQDIQCVSAELIDAAIFLPICQFPSVWKLRKHDNSPSSRNG